MPLLWHCQQCHSTEGNRSLCMAFLLDKKTDVSCSVFVTVNSLHTVLFKLVPLLVVSLIMDFAVAGGTCSTGNKDTERWN